MASDMPQSNKQHAVPQNFMDVEFKLIGDLTMRQFSYLLVFGVCAYLSYALVLGVFKWPMVAVFVLAALGFAFVPIEERGMDEHLINFLRAINTPTQRTWKKEPVVPTAFLADSLSVVRQELITLAPTSSRRKLEEYLEYQSSEAEVKDPLDIPEKEYMMKVRSAYAKLPVQAASVEKPETKSVPSAPKEKPAQTASQTTVASTAPKPVSKPAPKITKPKSSVTVDPMTPDMHSGRRFTNLLPSKGELVLPIRGERVIKTNEDLSSDYNQKSEQLEKLLSNIKTKEADNEFKSQALQQKNGAN